MKTIRKRFKKGTAVALTAALLAGLVSALPGAAGSVKAADGTTTSPSVSTYATKAQLMDDTFKPGADGTLRPSESWYLVKTAVMRHRNGTS